MLTHLLDETVRIVLLPYTQSMITVPAGRDGHSQSFFNPFVTVSKINVTDRPNKGGRKKTPTVCGHVRKRGGGKPFTLKLVFLRPSHVTVRFY